MDNFNSSSMHRSNKYATLDSKHSNCGQCPAQRGARGARGTHTRMTKLQRLDRRSLRIVAWNISSHKQRRRLVEQLLQINNIEALQETKIKEKPSYHGHKVFFAPSSEDGNAKRGLLTIVKNTIECCQINAPQTINGVETLAIAFTHSGKQRIIVNV